MRTVLALLFFSTIAFGQSDSPQACSAEGTVVNSVTGAPIARASVNGAVLTDASGRWSLDHLTCGNVNFSANRQGFVPIQTGTLPTRFLDAAKPLNDMTIRLAPQAVVTGHVRGEHGDPVENAEITMMASHVMDGKRGFVPQRGAPSNDIGEYRIAGLAAGRYMFCVKPANHNSPAVAVHIAYDPQCSDSITIPAGYNGIVDFQLTPAVPRHVRGVLSGTPEGTAPQVTLAGQPGTLATSVRDDGTFEFDDVASGSYTLTATAFDDSDRFIAALPVEVGDRDMDGLHLHLEKGLDVTGTIRVISPSGKDPDHSKYWAVLESSQVVPRPVKTEWSDNRTSFTFTSVMPGNYRLNFSASAPFYVKTATVGGRDIAASEAALGPGSPDIDVALSDDGGALEGDVTTGDGPARAFILLRQDVAAQWNGRGGMSDPKGHFKIEGLPPGDYKASAWDDIANVEYSNPAWMQLHAKSVSVTVQPGQTTQVKLERQVAPSE